MKRMMVYLLLGLAAMTVQAEVVVSNMAVAQRPGTKLVDFFYDVTSTETNAVTVSLSASNGTSLVSAPSVSGDVGAGVAIGVGKSMVWDAGADWGGNVASLKYVIVVEGEGGTSAVCPTCETGQTVVYRTGDDGDYEAGIEWPVPRFVDNGDGTVFDRLTGLEWIKAPHSLSGNTNSMSWNSAIDLCNELDFADHSDWRLPSINELLSLLDYGQWRPALPASHPFSNLKLPYNTYWSGTSTSSGAFAWSVCVGYGSVYTGFKSGSNPVWPVRIRQGEGVALLPKTGQTTSYRAGDDGDHQTGEEWPVPRFTETGFIFSEGTVIDHLTGLEWIKSPMNVWGAPGLTTWPNAIDFCNELDYAGYTDWRLPNVNELNSLLHREQILSDWFNGSATPFNDIYLGYTFWSSTTSKLNSSVAWRVSMFSGEVDDHGSKYEPYEHGVIWPVRTVQADGSEDSATAFSYSTTDSREYGLAMASEHGTPVPGLGSHTYAWMSSVTCSVEEVTADGWMFMGWSGDAVTDYAETNTVVLMDTVFKSVTANFSDDADGDGLLNTNEFAIGSNPRKGDSDEDGMSDPDELVAGTSPTNGASLLKAGFDLNNNKDLSWYGVSGRYYQLEATDSLTNVWIAVGDVLAGTGAELTIPDSSVRDARFYRVRVSVDPSAFE